MNKPNIKNEIAYKVPYMVARKTDESFISSQVDTILVLKRGNSLIEFVTEIPVTVKDPLDVNLLPDYRDNIGFVMKSDTVDLRPCNPNEFIDYIMEVEKQPFYGYLTGKINKKGKGSYAKIRNNII